MRETAPYCTSMGSRGCLAKDRLRTYVRTYVYVYMHTYVYVYIIACPLLVVPWEGKPSRWFLAGVAHYIYRCYIYKAPHTYVYVCVCICQRRRCFAQDRICICLSLCTYVCMYAHTCAYVRTYVYVYAYVCTCFLWGGVLIYVRTYMSMCVCWPMYVCVSILIALWARFASLVLCGSDGHVPPSL